MIWFLTLNPVLQGLIATLFTYSVTALGASLVFFFSSMNKKPMDLMMGFAAGVMIAASFWSLLAPAIELSTALGGNAWFTSAVGFLLGGGFVIGSDVILSKATLIRSKGTALKRSILLTFAVTLHNIPEGLAVGVAFGSAAIGIGGATVQGAAMLALGIGLQNFPEGVCVAMPLRRDGATRLKSFFVGQASGLVEPVAGVIGAASGAVFGGALKGASGLAANVIRGGIAGAGTGLVSGFSNSAIDQYIVNGKVNWGAAVKAGVVSMFMGGAMGALGGYFKFKACPGSSVEAPKPGAPGSPAAPKPQAKTTSTSQGAPSSPLMDQAIQARDALAQQIHDQPGGKPGAVTAGYDKQGNVSAACSGGGSCAEGNVAKALNADPADVTFTSAVRPKTLLEQPICVKCQATYSPNQFPPGVQYVPGGPWSLSAPPWSLLIAAEEAGR